MTDATDRLYELVLVVRCQAGDEAAFAELVERYQPRLRYYLRKMLGGRNDPDDVVQDVWLDVFRALSRLADASAFRAWLYRIARDRAWRELRKRRPQCGPLEESELETEASSFTVEDAEQLHFALDQLAPDHREVMVLRFVQNLSYDEISHVVGCPVGTVRSRLHYAKRALRDALDRINVYD